MTDFKPGDRVRITANVNEGVFDGTLGTYVGQGGIFHHVKPDIWPDTDYECFKTEELTKIEEESNMTKIKLSTGVEADKDDQGNVRLPGHVLSNTVILEASGVTWEPVREIEEVAFEDAGRQLLGRQVVGDSSEITNVDIYQEDVYVYSLGNEHFLAPGDTIKVYE